MAPRRNHTNIQSCPQELILVGGEQDPNQNNLSSASGGIDYQTFLFDFNLNNDPENINTSIMNSQSSENLTPCCVPTGECFKSNSSSEVGLISLDDLSDCVRVTCNNEKCTAGQYMHRECFESWEQTVLTAVKNQGRARSWSERQRAQNLWNKKGYDLIFKYCNCKCSHGHLRKDLTWQPPVPSQQNGSIYGRQNSQDDDASKKKKKRNRQNQKPTLALSNLNENGYHPNSKLQQQQNVVPSSPQQQQQQNCQELLRGRTGSLSSSSGSTSPPVSASSEHSISPIHLALMNVNQSVNDTKNQAQNQHQQQLLMQQQQAAAAQLAKQKVEIYSERVRSTSGCNGIFSRRIDFSSFNQLPKTRLNSYQVKMEDEGNHGNDETRLFILSSLAQNQKSRVVCVLCEEAMLVFDRYPLVDGTFFLSPKQYQAGCIEVKYEGRTQYLTAVCMGCIDGNACNRAIFCRFCGERWNGSSLVIGTMYSYDIFAAMPCCTERLKCNACFKLLLHPQQRLKFYSNYSHCITCSFCTTQDTHFVKPLRYCYTKQLLKTGVALP